VASIRTQRSKAVGAHQHREEGPGTRRGELEESGKGKEASWNQKSNGNPINSQGREKILMKGISRRSKIQRKDYSERKGLGVKRNGGCQDEGCFWNHWNCGSREVNLERLRVNRRGGKAIGTKVGNDAGKGWF